MWAMKIIAGVISATKKVKQERVIEKEGGVGGYYSLRVREGLARMIQKPGLQKLGEDHPDGFQKI